eukprot:TRINITY_DN857_c0_g1_i2.p1 TRINITY_DN857_c0_g1~~TRINITY_DN857_c0_g1_i2.p1  ORF type:complete len:248 (+),score=36.14 TRINITY_DN857_c0_g1_i2:51-794(+)
MKITAMEKEVRFLMIHEEDQFRVFLRQKLSEENMDFWLSCNSYLGTVPRIEELGRDIYREFIHPDSQSFFFCFLLFCGGEGCWVCLLSFLFLWSERFLEKVGCFLRVLFFFLFLIFFRCINISGRLRKQFDNSSVFYDELFRKAMREVEKSIAVNFLVEYKADKWRDNTSTKRAPCQLIFRREAWEDISFVESSDTESLSFASTSSPIREEKEPNSQSIEDALTYIEEYFQSRRVLFTDFRKFLQRV